VGHRAKEFRHAVDLGEGDSVRTEDGTPLGPGPEWTPEHLLLAGLLRCSMKSLRYHARRAGIDVRHATGSAHSVFTRRESDGRFAVTELEVALDVTLELG
jgi:organic hydroperoxide reductase OsmC/OhrA